MSAQPLALVGALALLALPHATLSLENMNGDYIIQELPDGPRHYNTSFASYPALGRSNNTVRYVESYSEEMSTLYSQVWWTMGPVDRFSDKVIREMDGKIMAIVGYEFDQVIKNADGTETAVPVRDLCSRYYVPDAHRQTEPSLLGHMELQPPLLCAGGRQVRRDGAQAC